MHGAYVSYIVNYGRHIWCWNTKGAYISYIHVAHLDDIHRSKMFKVQVYGKFLYLCVTYIWCIHMVHRYVSLYHMVSTTLHVIWGIQTLSYYVCESCFFFFYNLCVYIMYIVELSSNGDHHVLHPCLLQLLFVICMCYDLFVIIYFANQYSFPPKGQFFGENRAFHLVFDHF
jgi:hypothetical protein